MTFPLPPFWPPPFGPRRLRRVEHTQSARPAPPGSARAAGDLDPVGHDSEVAALDGTGLSTTGRLAPPVDRVEALALRPVAVGTLEPVETTLDPRPTAAAVGSLPVGPAVDLSRALPIVDLVTDAALDEAIRDDTRRHPRFTVRADWNRDQRFDHPLSELTDLVDELVIDRQIGGDLPPEVGLVEGHAAAQLSLTLSGQWEPDLPPDADPAVVSGDSGVTGPGHDGVDAVAAFAPYNPDAPLYGRATIGTRVVADTGFLTRQGVDLRRRFTGTITRVSPSSASRDVTLDALDDANRMRAPIYQAAVGMDGLILKRYGPARYNARINSQWLIDRIFRANGYYASPPPQPGAFVSATLHGSQIPEIGSGGVPTQRASAVPDADQAWKVGAHPFGMLAPNPDAPRIAGQWTAPVALTMLPGDGVGCSFWALMPARRTSAFLMQVNLDGGALSGSINNFHVLEIDILDGAPAGVIATPLSGVQAVASGSYVLPQEPTWRFIGVHFAFGRNEVTITINHDGHTQGSRTFPLALGRAGTVTWAPSTTVVYRGAVPMTNVTWFRSPFAPARTGQDQGGDDIGAGDDVPVVEVGVGATTWVGATWTPQADIDPGLNELTGLPQIDGEESWPLAVDIAGAEAARIGFDEHSRPYFRSRAVHRDPGPPEHLTSDRDLADLVTVTDEASVRNSVSSATTPLLVGDYEWVVESKSVGDFEIGAGANIFHLPLPPDTVIVDPWFLLRFNRLQYEAVGDHPLYRTSIQYACVYARRPDIIAPTNAVSFRLFPRDAGTVTLVVYNLTRHALRFQTEDEVNPQTGERNPGRPVLRIPGRRLAAQASRPHNIHDPGSVALFGERTLDLSGGTNRWHQHRRAVTGIGEGILATTAHPAPVLDTVEVPHDPRRRLVAPVVVHDPHGLGSAPGTVTGIQTRFAASSAAVDQLTVRPLVPPGFGVLEHETHGRVGESLVFGA